MPHKKGSIFERQIRRAKANRPFFWAHLRQENPKITSQGVDQFLEQLEVLARRYHKGPSTPVPYSVAREQLRDIFILFTKEKLDPLKIRRKIMFLPEEAQKDILERARVKFPDLCAPNTISWHTLCDWAQNCSIEELAEKFPLLITSGRGLSFGQKRADGVRSAPHVEPMIFGEFRRFHPVDANDDAKRTKTERSKGGRPTYDALNSFMQDFGLLWLETTGITPALIKGHPSSFGRVARLVLFGIGVRKNKAAIKRFFERMRDAGDRPTRVPWD